MGKNVNAEARDILRAENTGNHVEQTVFPSDVESENVPQPHNGCAGVGLSFALEGWGLLP